jgi:hypothetical protein
MSKLIKRWSWQPTWKLIYDGLTFNRSQIYRVLPEKLHDHTYVKIEYMEPGALSPTQTYLFQSANATEEVQRINELMQRYTA